MFDSNEKILKNIFYDHSPIPTYIWKKIDTNFILVDYNNASSEMTKNKIKNYIGIKVTELYKDNPQVFDTFMECFTSKKSISQEMYYEFQSTKEKRYLVVKYSYIDPDIILIHTIDINEQKKIENALRESELKFRTLAEVMLTAIFIFQGNKNVYVNPAAERISGFTAAELLKMNFWDVIHPDFKNKIHDHGISHQKSEMRTEQDEVKILTKRGPERWLFFSNTRIEFNGKPAILGTAFDISKIKQIEEELQSNKNRYQFLYEQNPTMYFTVSLKGIILSVNQFGTEQLGYKTDELLNKSILNIVHENDKDLVLNHFNKHKNNTDEITHLEFRKIRKDSKILWIKDTIRRVKDSNGNEIFLIVCEDITPLKQMQQEKEEFIHKQAEMEKLITLGQFTAEISHEINNPLDVILSLLFLLKNGINNNFSNEQLFEYLEKISHQTHRITAISKNILNYVKPHTIKFQAVDVNELLRHVIESIQTQYQNSLTIKTNFQYNIYSIQADPIGIELIFKNIILNSIESFKDNGIISISTKNIVNDKIEIKIEDNGIGIPTNNLDKVFDPFFTDKKGSKGTGLGLTICKKIIEQHNGTISIDSKLDKGTSVLMNFLSS